MLYYSTNRKSEPVSLREAVTRGLAPDNGLYMPETIGRFEPAFFRELPALPFREIAMRVAEKLFGEDIPPGTLQEIVYDTLGFDCPLVKVSDRIWALELFHGPTMAFKDVGARFMARMLRHFHDKEGAPLHVLVATSGDTGSAVANGFLGVEGIHVTVLYPSGKVSEIQEKQFSTLGRNISALEVEGTFDDCQQLVKEAFLDPELTRRMRLTSANSINVARFLPQSFYYFNAWARWLEETRTPGTAPVIAVPSGNFGNLTAGMVAREMGLPVARFIAANNENDIVYQYLKTGQYHPRPSVETLANAMDVGAPSNFARILDLYGHSHRRIREVTGGFRLTDDGIREVIRNVHVQTGYLCDPHGACGYAALLAHLGEHEEGIFLETAHPSKFMETMEEITGAGTVPLPERLAAFLGKEKRSVPMSSRYADFREWLLARANA